MPSGSVITMNPALISLPGSNRRSRGTQGDETVSLGLEGRHAGITLEAGSGPDV